MDSAQTNLYLNKLKILLHMTEDNERDNLLTTIIEHVIQRLLLRLEGVTETVPEELGYIVIEASVARFNRLANEGMSSVSVEGETLNFNEDELEPYATDIRYWLAAQEGTRSGKVRFI